MKIASVNDLILENSSRNCLTDAKRELQGEQTAMYRIAKAVGDLFRCQRKQRNSRNKRTENMPEKKMLMTSQKRKSLNSQEPSTLGSRILVLSYISDESTINIECHPSNKWGRSQYGTASVMAWDCKGCWQNRVTGRQCEQQSLSENVRKKTAANTTTEARSCALNFQG